MELPLSVTVALNTADKLAFMLDHVVGPLTTVFVVLSAASEGPSTAGCPL